MSISVAEEVKFDYCCGSCLMRLRSAARRLGATIAETTLLLFIGILLGIRAGLGPRPCKSACSIGKAPRLGSFLGTIPRRAFDPILDRLLRQHPFRGPTFLGQLKFCYSRWYPIPDFIGLNEGRGSCVS